MCFNHLGIGVKFVLVLLVLINSIPLNAQQTQATNQSVVPQLVAVPNQCVALRQGRECFATIQVAWQVSKAKDYCLIRSADALQIYCWQGKTEGRFSYVFRSATDEELQLVDAASKVVIAKTLIKVSWVYNSKKRNTRWRLF